jgi:PAS domain S-box-containing protein
MGKSSYEELEKELKELKNSDIRPLKEDHYKNFFDNMSEMVEVIELIYDKNNQPIDFYIRAINTSFAKFLGKTKKQLVNKKVSSVVDKIEENWFTSFAKVDKTGEPLRFKNYGAAFDKYYFVSVWKVSKKNIGVSFTDITKTEKDKIKLNKKLKNETKVRTEAEFLVKDGKLELYQTISSLDTAHKKITYQNKTKGENSWELKRIKGELKQQNFYLNKVAIVSETDADFNILFVNDNFCEIYGYPREELIGQNHRILKSGKQPEAFFTDMITTIVSGGVFKGEVLNKRNGTEEYYWMDLTIMPFKDLNGKIIRFVSIMFDISNQIKQKEILLNQADELVLANKELAFQYKEKEKRADELVLANKELAFQNKEKDNRADELVLANKELEFQNKEKEKRADELAIANKELAFQNKEKEKRADELVIANKELAFQNKEKEKRADELVIANKELAFQNKEKEKRADELVLANKELEFQNNEKEKRADELAIANKELAFQNKEKEKRADELVIANKELAFQNEEKGKRADELAIANKELAFQNEEKGKRADELAIAKKELIFQKELDSYRSEAERVALELTLLIDTANAPIFGIDSKGLVNEWNQTSEKITGFKKKEVFGKELVKTYITEDYQKSVKKVLDDALLGKETANYEFPLFSKDGERVMVLLNSSTRRDANGKITGVLGVGQDISEMDKLRTVSESVAKELRQFIETANAPIFGIDSKGLVNEWNQTSEKITGFRKEDVFGKNLVQTYITEDYRKSVKKVLDDALRGKETANYEFPLFTKNGERVMVLLNSSSRRDANGKITGVLGVGQDISEMDKLRTVSESIAKELRQFIETANAPIFGIDSKGLVNEWNQTSEKITGFKKEDVFGKNLVQTYITEDYRKSVKKVLDDALHGKETANYEFPLFTKNGERVMVLLNSSSRRDANGKITGVLGVGQDITELVGYRNELEIKVEERTVKLNQALEKQKELNELKSKFVSTASHEFRTPLSAINFAAGSIKKYWGKMEPVMIEKKLHKIEDQVMHMTKLLDDVLVIGQSGAGKIRNNPLNMPLGNFINEIIEEVYTSHEKSNKIVVIDTENIKNETIFIDEKLGRNIFINLISNAVKYSKNKENVTIEFSSEKDFTIVAVTDFGIGISKSELKTIFTPFSRGENVDLIQGTGLGLSIAKEAIDTIGGEIVVRSTLGYGATFKVKIPKNKKNV